MAGVLLNWGEVVALEALVSKAAAQPLILRLYKNDVTPAETDTEATYTEATFTGYAPITLTGANWVTSGTAPTQVAYAQQTFTSTAQQTAQAVYGYYLTQTTSGKAVASERFTGGPYTIQNLNDLVRVTPVLTQE